MNKFKKLSTAIVTLGAIFAMCACGGKTYDTSDFKSIEDIIADAKKLTGDSSSQSGTVEKKGASNFKVPEGGYDGSPVTIKFYSTQGSNLNPITDAAIAKFCELYPNITVEHTQPGSYDDVRDQIKTEIAVKNQPNIAYCYPDHVALYNLAKAVVTLDDLIDSTVEVTDAKGNKTPLGLTDAQKADFIEGYYNEGRQFGDGLMYSMPYSKSTEVLYYNKDVFTEENLALPTHWFSESAEDTTSMEYVCEKLKAKYPKSIPLGYDSEANWMITMTEQCGSAYTAAKSSTKEGHFLFDNPTNKALSKRFAEWYNKGWMTTQTIYGAYTSGLFVSDGTDESTPRSFMSIGSSAGATHQRPSKADGGSYPFEVGICEIPQMSQTHKKVISQGPSVCIFKKANAQEVIASWMLVKYLTTNVQYQAEFGIASGYVPVLKSVAQDPTYAADLALADGGDHISALAAKVCLEQESAYYTSPAFNGSSKARDEIGTALTQVLGNYAKYSTNEEINAFINETFDKAVRACVQSI